MSLFVSLFYAFVLGLGLITLEDDMSLLKSHLLASNFFILGNYAEKVFLGIYPVL